MAESLCPFSDRVNRDTQKRNCHRSFAANAERIAWLSSHRDEIVHSAVPVAILVLNVEDQFKNTTAEALVCCPERAVQTDSFLCSIVDRIQLMVFLKGFDRDAALKLSEMKDALAVVVIDYGVAEVFSVEKALEEKK